MSANYWRNRWVNALVHNGIERSAAEAAFAATYAKQSADFSKSPEIQALMAIEMTANGLTSSASDVASRTPAQSHA